MNIGPCYKYKKRSFILKCIIKLTGYSGVRVIPENAVKDNSINKIGN
jgi:hypothetical protein